MSNSSGSYVRFAVAAATLSLPAATNATNFYLDYAETWVDAGPNGGYQTEGGSTLVGPLSLNDSDSSNGGSAEVHIAGSVQGGTRYLVAMAAYSYPGSFGMHSSSGTCHLYPGTWSNNPQSKYSAIVAVSGMEAGATAGGASVMISFMSNMQSLNTIDIKIAETGPTTATVNASSYYPDTDHGENFPVLASSALASAVFYDDSIVPLNPGDINGDGIIDALDADFLQGAIAGGSSNVALSHFDLNNDSTLTSADIDAFLATYANTVRGDVDLDGDVDINDAAIVSANVGTPGFWTRGDFDGDRLVTSADLAYVTTNNGFGVP